MKTWILRWLGLAPKDNCNPPQIAGNSSYSMFAPECRSRDIFEIVDAANGKILVHNVRVDNPNGPDRNNLSLYLINDCDNLMDVIQQALVNAKLRQ